MCGRGARRGVVHHFCKSLPGVRPLHFHPLPRPPKWKRTLLLVPPLLGLFYVAVAEPSGRSIAKTITHKVFAALTDPLSLFSERSPGMRLAGQLLSTKGKTGPHERVLATVRDREPTVPPVVDNPVDDSTSAIPVIPPQYDAPPTDRTLGALPFVPPNPFIPPGFIPGSFTPPNQPPITTPEPPGPPGTNPPPGSPPPGGPPPDGPPPGTPPPVTPPGTPPATPIPEPSTWTLMLFGFFAVAAAGRRRKFKMVRGG